MKIKKDFILRPFSDQYLAMPVGDTAIRSPFMLSLNSTCAYVWELLTEERTYEELLASLTEKYDVDKETAQRDLDGFLKALKEAQILE